MRVAVSSPPIANEADFVNRVKEFEEEAWEELYEVYFPKMYRYLFVHVGDWDVAEDLAAEVFERACKGIRHFRYRGAPLSSWLYKVAHHTMVDWHRKRRRTLEVPTEAEPAQSDLSDGVVTRDELSRAMNGLTPEQRQVLVLRHVEGHSAASAGEIMGKKENAIRALDFRALASLRQAMHAKKDGKGT